MRVCFFKRRNSVLLPIGGWGGTGVTKGLIADPAQRSQAVGHGKVLDEQRVGFQERPDLIGIRRPVSESLAQFIRRGVVRGTQKPVDSVAKFARFVTFRRNSIHKSVERRGRAVVIPVTLVAFYRLERGCEQTQRTDVGPRSGESPQ